MNSVPEEYRDTNWQKIIISIVVAFGAIIIGLEGFSALVEVEQTIGIISSVITGLMILIFLQFVPDKYFELEFRRPSMSEWLLDPIVEILIVIVFVLLTFVNWFVIQFILDSII